MPLRLVFAGTPEFAVPSLVALLASPHRLVGVVSQPDRPKGRSGRPTPAPVAALALARALPLVRPKNSRDPALPAALDNWRPDCLVVVACGFILSDAVLARPRLAALNAHASLLPKYRGAAPIPHAILAGEAESGVTVFRITRELDTGPILLQRRLALAPDETTGSLTGKLAELCGASLLEALALLEAGRAEFREQDEARASYVGKLTKADGRLDWTRGAVALDRQVRAMNPWPGGFTDLAAVGGAPARRLKIHRLRPAPEANGSGALSGTVLPPPPVLAATDPPAERLPRGRLIVACGPGGREAVELLELQAEGGRALAAAEFLRGHRLEPGMRLGFEE